MRAGARLLWAGLLVAGLAGAAAFWWPAPPVEPPAPAALPFAGVPAPAAPTLAAPAADPAAMPQLRVPPGSGGQDPLAAALAAARERPQPPPPPEIAKARTLEEAFAAMQAAQGQPPPAAAGASPFGGH